MNKLKIKDFLWSTIGSVIFGFISLFFYDNCYKS